MILIPKPKFVIRGVYRGTRGGGWTYNSQSCESSHSNWNGMAFQSKYIGLRIVRRKRP